jgi:hypothetical protein
MVMRVVIFNKSIVSHSIDLFDTARAITPNVVLFLPRSSNRQQLASMAGGAGVVEIELNKFDDKIETLTAYYGSLINAKLVDEIDNNNNEYVENNN